VFTSRIGRLIGAGYLEFARRQNPRPMGLLVRAPGMPTGGFQLDSATVIFFWLLPTLIGVSATEI
jgi:hypothetical protein